MRNWWHYFVPLFARTQNNVHTRARALKHVRNGRSHSWCLLFCTIYQRWDCVLFFYSTYLPVRVSYCASATIATTRTVLTATATAATRWLQVDALFNSVVETIIKIAFTPSNDSKRRWRRREDDDKDGGNDDDDWEFQSHLSMRRMIIWLEVTACVSQSACVRRRHTPHHGIYSMHTILARAELNLRRTVGEQIHRHQSTDAVQSTCNDEDGDDDTVVVFIFSLPLLPSPPPPLLLLLSVSRALRVLRWGIDKTARGKDSCIQFKCLLTSKHICIYSWFQQRQLF